MLISDNQYLAWQKKLAENNFFRRFWVFWGIYSVLIYVLVAGYFFGISGDWKIVLAGVTTALFDRYIICPAVFVFYKKQHPYQRLGFSLPTSWLFSFKDSKPDAFPSQHASFFAPIVVIIWYISRPLGLLCLAVAIMMSWARIILGYHDFKDVLAGWLIGLLTGFIVAYFALPLLFTR